MSVRTPATVLPMEYADGESPKELIRANGALDRVRAYLSGSAGLSAAQSVIHRRSLPT
jgi:hypothetical protein